ncbi:MAG: hypothetical protein KY455_07480 [Euryarchaeota archaeon]|nr:hypothetical protein [Euryarchaeota archaeon]
MTEEFQPSRRTVYSGVAMAVFFSFVAVAHVGILYHVGGSSWSDWIGVCLALVLAWLMLFSVRSVARCAVRIDDDGIATGDGRFVRWEQVTRLERGKGWGLLGWSEEHLIVHYADDHDGSRLRFTERLVGFSRLKERVEEKVKALHRIGH